MLIMQICLALLLGSSTLLADDQPDWGYAYQNPHYLPDNAPKAVASFHEVFIPMYEARHSRESAFIRENANQLLEAARLVPGSLPADASAYQSKHFRRAAKDLVRSCKRLSEIVHGGANAEVYDQMRQIERDYLRIANLLD